MCWINISTSPLLSFNIERSVGRKVDRERWLSYDESRKNSTLLEAEDIRIWIKQIKAKKSIIL